MRNYVQRGEVLTVLAPYDLLSGDGCLVGSLFGVSAYDVLTGGEAELNVVGVFQLPKGTGALDVGDPVYWDDTAKVVSGAGTVLIGVATEVAEADSPTAVVRLNGHV
jgi:predicted RecA/RadA family phage recombinase